MKKILVVEDDTTLLKVYSEVLATQNLDVATASNAQDALAQMRLKKPDLLLLDIMLPGGMNGFDLMELLKKDDDFKNIPIIIMTNLDTEKNTAMSIGATDYIIKSDTSVDEIIQKVKQHLQ